MYAIKYSFTCLTWHYGEQCLYLYRDKHPFTFCYYGIYLKNGGSIQQMNWNFKLITRTRTPIYLCLCSTRLKLWCFVISSTITIITKEMEKLMEMKMSNVSNRIDGILIPITKNQIYSQELLENWFTWWPAHTFPKFPSRMLQD